MAPEPARLAARFAAAVALLLLAAPAHALRVVDWNILNYPGTTSAARDPLYRTVLAPLGLDVLATEEMSSQAGVTEYLANLNAIEPGLWAAAPFVDGNDTDSGFFWKTTAVQFLGQWAFYPNPATNLRYVHVYRVKPVGYTSAAAEFRIYAVHLKASSGSANELARAAEAAGLRDSLNAMPAGTHALVMGDYNFYKGTEAALQTLVASQANNIGQLYDPLGLQNLSSWEDNVAMQYAWTQSPCKTGDTGCANGAATGGMDDRFDLILPTTTFQDGAGLELVPGTYVSVGNDGLHHNNSIMDPPTIPEGAAYAAALHGVSDHLPVRVDLRLPAILNAGASALAFGSAITGASVSQPLTVLNAVGVPGEPLSYSYSAPAGFTAPAGTLQLAPGASQGDAIGMDTSTPGVLGGTLVLASNAADDPSRAIALSGTVLRHAAFAFDPPLQSTPLVDFGAHDSASFTPVDVHVHNPGWDALQARLLVSAATITGGDGRFSVVGGFSPALVADTALTTTLAFDAAGATPDSAYQATLAFSVSDEPLPGASATVQYTLNLTATRQGQGTTAVESAPPSATMLYAPYPNPLRSASTVRFDLAHAGDVALEVFDVGGRRVATLLHGALEPGRYSVRWNGGTDGASAHPGLYFVRLTTAGVRNPVARIVVMP